MRGDGDNGGVGSAAAYGCHRLGPAPRHPNVEEGDPGTGGLRYFGGLVPRADGGDDLEAGRGGKYLTEGSTEVDVIVGNDEREPLHPENLPTGRGSSDGGCPRSMRDRHPATNLF
jgi:hypothetical protein